MRNGGALESSPQCALSTDTVHMHCEYLVSPFVCFPLPFACKGSACKVLCEEIFKLISRFAAGSHKITGASSRPRYQKS